jgi:hypothetical protein
MLTPPELLMAQLMAVIYTLAATQTSKVLYGSAAAAAAYFLHHPCEYMLVALELLMAQLIACIHTLPTANA